MYQQIKHLLSSDELMEIRDKNEWITFEEALSRIYSWFSPEYLSYTPDRIRKIIANDLEATKLENINDKKIPYYLPKHLQLKKEKDALKLELDNTDKRDRTKIKAINERLKRLDNIFPKFEESLVNPEPKFRLEALKNNYPDDVIEPQNSIVLHTLDESIDGADDFVTHTLDKALTDRDKQELRSIVEDMDLEASGENNSRDTFIKKGRPQIIMTNQYLYALKHELERLQHAPENDAIKIFTKTELKKIYDDLKDKSILSFINYVFFKLKLEVSNFLTTEIAIRKQEFIRYFYITTVVNNEDPMVTTLCKDTDTLLTEEEFQTLLKYKEYLGAIENIPFNFKIINDAYKKMISYQEPPAIDAVIDKIFIKERNILKKLNQIKKEEKKKMLEIQTFRKALHQKIYSFYQIKYLLSKEMLLRLENLGFNA